MFKRDMNVSSIVVQTTPKYLNKVVNLIKASNFCDYHMHDKRGRIVVTIDGVGIEEEIEKFKKIRKIPHVFSAVLIYSYCENELNNECDKIMFSKEIPNSLNDDNIFDGDINYQGVCGKNIEKKT